MKCFFGVINQADSSSRGYGQSEDVLCKVVAAAHDFAFALDDLRRQELLWRYIGVEAVEITARQT